MALPALINDDIDYIKVWVEAMTGLAVDDEGSIYAIEAGDWQEKHERLRQLGGPPKTEFGWLLDPILYGPDPAARARAWTERNRWADAEAAYTEVVRARPLRSTAWLERGRFYSTRSEPRESAR